MLDPDRRKAFGFTLSMDKGIELSPGMPSTPILDATGLTVAVVHGYVLQGWHGPSLNVSDNHIIYNDIICDIDHFVKQVIFKLHGSFFSMTQGPIGEYLVPDFGGSIPIYWCQSTSRAGSSAYKMFDRHEYVRRFNQELHRKMILSRNHGWITGSLTAHEGLRRLLPCHVLDLSKWASFRVWPKKGDLSVGRDPTVTASEACEDIRRYVECCVVERGAALTMTAGYDSRLLTAATRNVTDKMQAITFGRLEDGLDQQISKKLADTLNISHKLIPVIRASSEQSELWDSIVGHNVREINREIHPTLCNVDSPSIITGIYGETGRAKFYPKAYKDFREREITAADVCSLLSLPDVAEQNQDIEEWLAGVSQLPYSVVLDLSYNELRVATWGMSQAPAQKLLKMSFMPFAQFSVQKAFMETDPQYRRQGLLFDDIIHILWPECLKLPINKYDNIMDHVHLVRKIIDRVSRKLFR